MDAGEGPLPRMARQWLGPVAINTTLDKPAGVTGGPIAQLVTVPSDFNASAWYRPAATATTLLKVAGGAVTLEATIFPSALRATSGKSPPEIATTFVMPLVLGGVPQATMVRSALTAALKPEPAVMATMLVAFAGGMVAGAGRPPR